MLKTALALSLLFALGAAAAQERVDCLVIGSSFESLDLLVMPGLGQELADHGICVTFEKLPGRRSTVSLLEGKTDGELLRAGAYLEHVKDVAFAVPEPLIEAEGLIVSLSPQALETSATGEATLAYMDGFRWHEPYVPNTRTTLRVPSYASGFKMLSTGRVTGLLIDTISFEMFRETGVDYHTRALTPKLPAYLYLHNRHLPDSELFAKAVRAWRAKFYEKWGLKTN